MKRQDSPEYHKAQTKLANAQKFLQRGDALKAKELLSEVLKALHSPRCKEERRVYGRLWFALGEAKERLGQRNSALTAYENALESDEGLRDAAHRIVEYKLDSPDALGHDMVPHYIDYAATGRSQSVQYGALRRLQQILRIQLTDRRAEIPWRMEMLERLQLVKPDINFLKLYLGRGYYLREDYAEAVDCLTRLSSAASGTNNVLNIIGRCHEKLRQFPEARSAYEQSLSHTPNQPGVQFRLGRIALILAEISS